MQGEFCLTSSCNLNCVYCYEGKNKKNTKTTKEIIDKSVDLLIKTMQFQNDKKLKIIMLGGEPFLAFDMMKYLVMCVKQKAQKEKIEVSFGCTTNATLLNDDIKKFILNEIDDFTISIDGGEKTQNYSRPFINGKGSFKVVEKNLLDILELYPDIRIRMTFNHNSVEYLFDNIKYLIKLGLKWIVPARDFYDNDFSEDTFNIMKKELLKVKKLLKNHPDVHVSMLDIKMIKKLGFCSGGLYSIVFDADGSLYPCMLTMGHEEFKIGDVFNGIDFEKRDKLLSYSKMENKECNGCDFYNYCTETRCKMINKLLVGEFCTASPVSCKQHNILYEVNFCE